MHNLQLIDTLNGGSFVFSRNDYSVDEGIYSELYACMFGTSRSEWLGDNAFDIQSPKIASRTENMLRVNNSNSSEDISLIKKAVRDDLDRLVDKNPELKIESVQLSVYTRNSLEIKIVISGFDDSFNYVYQKTEESIDNLNSVDYDI